MSGDLRVLLLLGPIDATPVSVRALDLAVALRRLGHEAAVLGGRGNLVPRFESAGVPVDALDLSGSFLLDLPRLGEIRAAAAARSPGVLHVLDARLARVGGMLARMLGRPAVLSVRDPSEAPRLTSPAFREVLLGGRALRDELIARRKPVSGRCRVLPAGVDAGRHGDPAPPFDGERPIVGAVSGLVPGGGHGDLLEAARRLLAEERELHLLLAGHGPESAPLRRRARDLGIASRVTVTDLPADLERIHATIDVFVHPAETTWAGGEILEAMAAARPVVATGVGQALALVHEGETGRLVPRGSPGELAAAIASLLDDPERATAMGRAGREVAVRSHGIDATAREALAVYREAAQEDGA